MMNQMNVYEEAVADVKDLMAVAEKNARDKVIDAVTPHIRSLIENTLLAEGDEGDEATGDDDKDDLLLDDGIATQDAESPDQTINTQSDAISMPDEEGKITLDLDALDVSDNDEVELDVESFDALRAACNTNIKVRVSNLVESVHKACKKRSCDIASLVTKVDDMYEHVHTAQLDANTRRECESRLGECLSELINTERKIMKTRKTIREEDETTAAVDEKPGELTLKLSGLPADVDLENVGVDLIADDQGEDTGEETASEEGDEDIDLGDLDLSSDEGDEDENPEQTAEGAEACGDDEIIEIDEAALRSEVSKLRRARRIREAEGVDKAVMDDFGGGDPEEEPFVDGDEIVEIDEAELALELQNRRKADERGTRVADGHFTEARNRRARAQRLRNESRLHSRANRFSLKERAQGRAESGSTENDRLRKQLLAQNLDNVKLACANKLLQVESLTHRQKSAVIRRLDGAKTVAEAKAVYGSVVRAVKSQSLNESARVRPAGGSTVTKPASAVITESATNDGNGFSLDRWAVLSGITPRR